MRDRATSSAAGAGGGGGGAGGRDPDDAWREEHAVAWGQSTVERAALRSQYAAVRGTIRELKDDPALGKFDAAVDRIEMLHDKVQRSLEQLADGEALLDLADVLVSSTKAENRDGPTPSEFVTALLRKFGVTDTPLDSSNESFSWSSLGGAVSALFMTATGCQTMNGPMDLAIKERSCVVRKQSESLGSRPAEPDELPPDQDERNDTDENLAVMFRLLIRHKSDGRAEINVVDNGDHFVAPRNAPTAGSIASRKVTNNQFVFRFDTKDWEIMKYMVKPGEQLMPHRSSYCGGEYKNTQSYPGRSKLGSDSEHLKQDEFAKEEAMKENLADRCSGDDTLKKRKRQHVARRLFSADD
ncbi:hypothetical protein SEVIR_6G213500v4 [Setaria viridis]|nr:non-structural maintenance of chromosomes element 4 homolog A-like isoform X2 [Setaria viridis]